MRFVIHNSIDKIIDELSNQWDLPISIDCERSSLPDAKLRFSTWPCMQQLLDEALKGMTKKAAILANLASAGIREQLMHARHVMMCEVSALCLQLPHWFDL